MVVTSFLQKSGITVLSTTDGATDKITHGGFVFLTSDIIKFPRVLQDSFFSNIKQSAAHVVVNVNGYLGLASVMEIGFSVANGVTVYSICPVRDATISLYVRNIEEIFPDFFKHNKISCETDTKP